VIIILPRDTCIYDSSLFTILAHSFDSEVHITDVAEIITVHCCSDI
jgi:hypothetical protein